MELRAVEARSAVTHSGRRVRGGEIINHGRVRTRDANACAFLNEGERKRSLSVLVRGSKRLQRVGIEEKRHDTDERDAVLVAPGLFVKVARDHHLAKVVVDMAKRKCLLGSSKAMGALEISWISPRNFKLEFALSPTRSLCHVSFGGGGGRFAAARSVLFIWNAKRWHGLCRFQKR